MLAIRGRINFLQLERYSGINEKTFRNNFSKKVDWLKLNTGLIDEMLPDADNRVIALDPAHISKSGKCTPGIGMYWSGSSGKSVYGLELTAFAAIDSKSGDCLMLGAAQTLPEQDEKGNPTTMTQCYLKALKDRAKELLRISTILVADSFFSRKTFVLPAIDMGFTLVSKFPVNASLQYLVNDAYLAQRGTKRGYMPKYAGRVDVRHMDEMFAQEIRIERVGTFHTAIVYSVSLKRNVRVVVGRIGDRECVTLFCTDTDMDARRIVEIYRKRFRIEFGIRDAKQFTGLTHNQSRNKDRINFAYNVSFFARNVLQTEVKLLFPKYSVGKLKKIISDTLFALKILETSGINIDDCTLRSLSNIIIGYSGAVA